MYFCGRGPLLSILPSPINARKLAKNGSPRLDGLLRAAPLQKRLRLRRSLTEASKKRNSSAAQGRSVGARAPSIGRSSVSNLSFPRMRTWLHKVRNLGSSTRRRVSAMCASGRSREIAGIFAHLCEGSSWRFPTLRANSHAAQRAIQSAICRLPNGATAIGRGALLSLWRLMFGMVHLENCISRCPFGLWRHPLPCLSLAHTNICIHIGRSVGLS